MSISVNPGDLVAVASPPSSELVRTIREVWDGGAAVLPLDHRDPGGHEGLLAAARPTIVVGADHDWHRRTAAEPVPESVALVIRTSGTSGRPRFVELDRTAVVAAVRSSAERLQSNSSDPWLCCIPPAHVGGMLVILRAAVQGAKLVVHPSFDVRAVATAEAAFTSLVPTQLFRLLDAGVDLGRFRAILVGGDRVTPELADRARDAGARLVETYGLTESCGGVVYDGRPLEGVRIRLGSDNEVQLRGPTIMRGYRFDPEATQAAVGPDGWLRTGDAGLIDGDDLLRLTGRLDDVVVTGGEKVHPEAVEAVLRRIPSVGDVAVTGRPDPEWGQRVVAFVVPSNAAAPPALGQLREAILQGGLPHAAVPRELVVVDALPRTGSGKLRRRDLQSHPPTSPQ